MADDNSKPAIPAWQRAFQQPQPSEGKAETDTTGQNAPTQATSKMATPIPEEPAGGVDVEESTSADNVTSSSNLDHIKTFLEDPAVKDQPLEKKRAFFESKGIPIEHIDEVLKQEEPSFRLNDFESFKQSQEQPRSAPQPLPQPPQQRTSGPPIITYPEFLVEAHKPPPLITPARIVNTAYIAGGIAALIYGASKYLVTPMSDSLTEARHDFATHSQSKVDEMNERLSKLVSKVPEPKKEKTEETETSDIDSETSDPTELYHRDMGTQTSPLPSRRSSLSTGLPASEKKKDQLTYQTNGLAIMQSHLTEMLQRTEALEQPNKDRLDKANNLRHYLDTLMYASPGINVWSSTDDEKSKDGKQQDVIEDLKKEIRGVKGVLLSAKRFPGVAGRVGT